MKEGLESGSKDGEEEGAGLGPLVEIWKRDTPWCISVKSNGP